MSAIDADRGALGEAGRAFDAEFQQVQRSAFLLARRLGRSTDEALDAVQDAAERAWRYRATRHGPFRPWFLAIVYRTATRPRLRNLPLPAAWRPAPATNLVSEHDPDLLAALGHLPGRQRAALWLRYCEDLSTGGRGSRPPNHRDGREAAAAARPRRPARGAGEACVTTSTWRTASADSRLT